MKTLTGKTRIAFLFFFASHIPVTLMIDSQALCSNLHPPAMKKLLTWYTDLFNDDLMRYPHDVWFKAIIGGELLLQLPFFFVALFALLNAHRVNGKGWFRSACMIYGTHTATTLIPIFTCHYSNPNATILEKTIVISIYMPYLVFPLWLVYIALASEDVFGKTTGTKSKQT